MEKEGKTKSLAQIAADDIIKLIKDNNMVRASNIPF